MRPVRVTSRPPVVFLVLAGSMLLLALVCAWAEMRDGSAVWGLAVPMLGLVTVFAVVSAVAATSRIVLEPGAEPGAEPTLEVGSVLRRSRVPLREVARVRLGHVAGGRGPASDRWQLVGHDGRVLGTVWDIGLPMEDVRALRTEVALARIPVGHE